MNLSKTIVNLANAYDETIWSNFSKCFPEVTVNTDNLGLLPKDILNVLIELLGIEQTKEWIRKKLNALDNNSAIELLSSDIGTKALKMFILSMPN